MSKITQLISIRYYAYRKNGEKHRYTDTYEFSCELPVIEYVKSIIKKEIPYLEGPITTVVFEFDRRLFALSNDDLIELNKYRNQLEKEKK